MTRPERDKLLQALATLAGIPLDEMGPSVCAMLGKHLKKIQESTPNVTVDEMRKRYRRFRKLWPDVHVTHKALAFHWAELSERPVVIHGDLAEEPANWRERHLEIFPEMSEGSAAYLATTPWGTLGHRFRERILLKCSPSHNVVPFKIA